MREVSEAIAPSLRPGDLVVATQPEQVSVLDYYLPEGLRYATLTGAVPDVGVTDWRDGVERLRATRAERDLQPLLDTVPPGRRVVLVVPQIYALGQWRAPWTVARAAALGGVARSTCPTTSRFGRTDDRAADAVAARALPGPGRVYVRR